MYNSYGYKGGRTPPLDDKRAPCDRGNGRRGLVQILAHPYGRALRSPVPVGTTSLNQTSACSSGPSTLGAQKRSAIHREHIVSASLSNYDNLLTFFRGQFVFCYIFTTVNSACSKIKKKIK